MQLTCAASYESHMAMHTSTANTDISLSRESQHENMVCWIMVSTKCASKRNWTDNNYHFQDKKYVPHTSVKMSCSTTQFPYFSFFGPHAKPHVVRGLSKHYHLRLDPKFGHGKCAIRKIPFDSISCTTMLYNPWAYGVRLTKHPHFQPVVDYTYWPVIGSFNHFNIIKFTNKITSSEDFGEMH